MADTNEIKKEHLIIPCPISNEISKVITHINRAKLRGEPLEKDCYRANTIDEMINDNSYGTFCLGLYKEFADGIEIDDVRKECLECKAYVRNNE